MLGSDPFALASAALALVLAIVLLAVLRNRRDLLLLLLGVSSGVELQLGGRLHLATVLSLGLLVTGRFKNPQNFGTAAITVLCALPLAVTVFLGDSVENPLLAGQLLLLAGTAAIVPVACDAKDVRLVLCGLLAAATTGSAVAVLQNIGVVPGTLYSDSTGIARVQSFYREPDFLGAFAAVGVLLAFHLVTRRWLQVLLLSINAFALAYTFARAAWLALAAASLTAYVVARFDRRSAPPDRSNRALLTGLVIVGAAVLASNAVLRDTIMARIEGVTSSARDVAVEARQRQFDKLISLGVDAPWYGHGLSASGQVGAFGYYKAAPGISVASNWILGWWMDGKLLAIPLIAWFLVSAVRGARHLAGQALILLLINSLFSNLMFFPITWLMLGCVLIGDGGAPARRLLASRQDAGS